MSDPAMQSLVERNLAAVPWFWRPRYVHNLWGCGAVETEWLAQRLIQVWTSTPFPTSVLHETDWRRLFTATGFVTEMGPTPPPAFPPGRTTVRLFRAAAAGFENRLSWTPNPALAALYANDYRLFRPKVWYADVPRDRLLAASIANTEYLVDTRQLLVEAVPDYQFRMIGADPTWWDPDRYPTPEDVDTLRTLAAWLKVDVREPFAAARARLGR